jgi:hypothetical protein
MKLEIHNFIIIDNVFYYRMRKHKFLIMNPTTELCVPQNKNV